MHSLKKKVLLFEGGKSLHLDDQITLAGLAGALRVMQHLGMRDFSSELEKMEDSDFDPVLIDSSDWIRAKFSGMFHPSVMLGTLINKVDILGSISDPFGFFGRYVKSPSKGYMICINQSPIVNQGDAISHISRNTGSSND